MIKTSITLQELRRKIYMKAKADKAHRFWGLYVHVCKQSTLLEAYHRWLKEITEHRVLME
jgi:RNA-directed DNA polymerase